MTKKILNDFLYSVRNKLNNSIGQRFSLTGLTEFINSTLDETLSEKDMLECIIDGKTESPNEIYDDHFGFNLEKVWGDLYVDLYFIKTNEELYYITECAICSDAWKLENLEKNVEMCGFVWDEVISFEPNKPWEHNENCKSEEEECDDWLVGKFTEGELWMNNNHGYAVLITPPTDIRDRRFFFRYF